MPSNAPAVEPGDRFGRWAVLAFDSQEASGARRYLCRCECGTERSVAGRSLRSGRTTSCGCRRREVTAERGRANHQHGHRATRSRTYESWLAMWTRCTSPAHRSYASYGGRGITVCEEWRSFEAFLADMGERPEGRTLDRIGNDGSYCKSNCRWATPAEQAANRRPPRADSYPRPRPI